jgi:hypothetical protein
MTGVTKHHLVLPTVSRGYPSPEGRLPMHYSPFRRSSTLAGLVARLACLIHAANVHSEPGSNPSIVCTPVPLDTFAPSGTLRTQERLDHSTTPGRPEWLLKHPVYPASSGACKLTLPNCQRSTRNAALNF